MTFSFLVRNLVFSSMTPSLRFFLIISCVSVARAVPRHTSDHNESNFECDGDHMCSPGFFCYTETNMCAPCISCASRFRQNSTWQCHQKASDCGDCLPGYQEPDLERNIEKESCTSVQEGFITTSKNSASPSGDTEEMLTPLWIVLCGFCILLVVIGSFLLTKMHKERRNSEPHQQPAQELQELVSRTDQPPPPYSPFAQKMPTSFVDATPTAPTMDSTLQVDSPRNCDATIYVETQPRHLSSPPQLHHEVLVQAKPCRSPEWVNDEFCSAHLTATPTSSTGNSLDGPDLEDDNTQPSDWTPNTSQENVEESSNQLMSFHCLTPPIGSTAVGTVEPPIHRGANHPPDFPRVRRRENEDDNEGIAPSQESCDCEPQEKRMRSSSPQPCDGSINNNNNSDLNNANMNSPLQQTCNANTNNNALHNSNVNNSMQQTFQTIQINLNLSPSENHRTDAMSSPSLLDSEDFL